jgi:hypothetical protein
MPVFIAKHNESREEYSDEQGGHELLGTIRMPKNLNLLTERLPKSQYDSDKKEDEPFVAVHGRGSANKLQSIQEEEDYRTVIPTSRQDTYAR